MEIEIVEFYPDTRKKPKIKGVKNRKYEFTGTLHVYLIDLDADLRGIKVQKRGNNWWFGNASKSSWDSEEKKQVSYPVFCFTDKEKQKGILDQIIEKGRKYIEENYLNKDKKK